MGVVVVTMHYIWPYHFQTACYSQVVTVFILITAVTPSSGCLKLKDEDWRSLTEYFSEACKSRTEIETLCDLLMKTQACNDLGRESILNPRNLAKNYLEQNPGACWKDIVRALCEMSKNRIAMKVVEKHNLNIKDCNEIRAS